MFQLLKQEEFAPELFGLMICGNIFKIYLNRHNVGCMVM
jgi:hypothetical protein